MSDHDPEATAPDVPEEAPSKPKRKARTPRASAAGTGRRKPREEPVAEVMRPSPLKRLRRWLLRAVLVLVGGFFALVLLFTFVPPIYNHYQLSERLRLGRIEKEWVSLEQIAPVMARSAVAAEDANFCNHWGFDMGAIREAISAGSNRGASTISQQVVKNVFLWQDRSWLRKALEAAMTPVVELVWSKRRILEVYLNVAEFDEGVFGVQAAARHYFGVDAGKLTEVQAARLAAILPDPKNRSASKPSDFVRRRARQIISGAQTIRADGRSACFER